MNAPDPYPAPQPAETKGLRDRLAEDRTVLANERTYLAWLRTGIGMLVAGLAIEALQGDIMPPWLVTVISFCLISLSLLMFTLASWRRFNSDPELAASAVRQPARGLSHAIDVFLMLVALFALGSVIYTSVT